MNQVTQWLDLSQVYNSRAFAAQVLNRDQAAGRQDKLRVHNGAPGSEGNLLPR